MTLAVALYGGVYHDCSGSGVREAVVRENHLQNGVPLGSRNTLSFSAAGR